MPTICRIFSLVVSFFAIVSFCETGAAASLVGVNVVHPQQSSSLEQEKIVAALKTAGVKSVRVGLGEKADVSGVFDFLERLKDSGIGILLEISLTRQEFYDASAGRRPADPNVSSVYSVYHLSDLNAERIRGWAVGLFDDLDRRNIALDGIEIGNEINGAAYNGDIVVPGSGRVWNLPDLISNPAMRNVALGFRRYVDVVRSIYEVRKRSRLNFKAPIISAGMLDFRSSDMKTGSSVDVVGNDAALSYMKSYGLNKFVDAYGLHFYPNSDAQLSAAARMSGIIERLSGQCGIRADGYKPCYITEWGVRSKSAECSNDADRTKIVQQIKQYFDRSIVEGRIEGLYVYEWSGRADQFSIYRCGQLSEAGVYALKLPSRLR